MSRFTRFPLVPAFVGFFVDDEDKVAKKYLTDPSEMYANQTGWQRVKNIFKSE